MHVYGCRLGEFSKRRPRAVFARDEDCCDEVNPGAASVVGCDLRFCGLRERAIFHSRELFRQAAVNFATERNQDARCNLNFTVEVRDTGDHKPERIRRGYSTDCRGAIQ